MSTIKSNSDADEYSREHESTLPKPKDSQARLIRWALILTAANVVIVVGAGLITLPKIVSTLETTGRVQDGIDIQGCRSLYNADVVTAQANALVVVLAGLKATATDDDGGLQDLITPDPTTNVTPYDTTVRDIYEARDEYKRAVDLSNTHPDKFMERCLEKQGKKTQRASRPVPSSSTSTPRPGD